MNREEKVGKWLKSLTLSDLSQSFKNYFENIIN